MGVQNIHQRGFLVVMRKFYALDQKELAQNGVE